MPDPDIIIFLVYRPEGGEEGGRKKENTASIDSIQTLP